MKKILYFISIVLTASLAVGCKNNKTDNDAAEKARQDSIRQADSLKKVYEKDSIAWASFTTPDLMAAGVHGHVQMIKETRGQFGVYVAYNFDENGVLTSYTTGDDEGDVETYKLTRDAQGRISTLKELHAEEGSNITTYTYDANGKPTSVKTDYEVDNSSEITVITLDEQGRSASYDSKYYRSGCAQTVKSYKYTKADSLGNWTMCSVTNKFRRSLTGESGLSKAQFENDDPETYIRTYSYYPVKH